MQHKNITDAILGCSYDVINELGCGFLESVYEAALCHLLNERGFNVKLQHPIAVLFRGVCVGNFYADLLVEDTVIVELKSVKALCPEHQAQLINYLQATGIEVGLLTNFGNQRLDVKRLTRSK